MLFMLVHTFWLSLSLTAQVIDIDDVSKQFHSTLSDPRLSRTSCYTTLRGIHDKLAKATFADVQAAEPSNIANRIAQGQFLLSDHAHRWRAEGVLKEEDQALLASVHRVGFMSMATALLAERVLRPLKEQGRLHEFRGAPHDRAEPIYFFIDRVENRIRRDDQGSPTNFNEAMPEMMAVSMRGGPNSFVSPFISLAPPGLRLDGRLSHTALNGVYKGERVSPEGLIEDGNFVRRDQEHSDFQWRMKHKLGAMVIVEPRDPRDQEGFSKLVHYLDNLPTPGRYNFTMAPGKENAFYCSQLEMICRQMARDDPNYRPFFLSTLDFGADYPHKMIGIARGQEVYSPLNVTQNPDNQIIAIAIEPVMAYEEVIASAVQMALNDYLAANFEYESNLHGAFMLREVYAPIRRWIGDVWPPYPGPRLPFTSIHPLRGPFVKFQQKVPLINDDQATFLGAGQEVFSYLRKKLRRQIFDRIRSGGLPYTDQEAYDTAHAIISQEIRDYGPLSRMLLRP